MVHSETASGTSRAAYGSLCKRGMGAHSNMARMHRLDVRPDRFFSEDADRTGEGDGPPLIHAIMRTRKQLSEVAMHAPQLELQAQGGAGYAAGSPTARRWREAAFLPLQTPTLAQLQHQLAAMGG